VASDKSADKKQEYGDQAMRMLRFAEQSGYKNAAHIAKDKDLNVLRGRDDFKKLMQSLASPGRSNPPGCPQRSNGRPPLRKWRTDWHLCALR
jgi:hypothetical protein